MYLIYVAFCGSVILFNLNNLEKKVSANVIALDEVVLVIFLRSSSSARLMQQLSSHFIVLPALLFVLHIFLQYHLYILIPASLGCSVTVHIRTIGQGQDLRQR